MNPDTKFFLTLFAIGAVLLAMFVTGLLGISRYQCNQVGDMSGKPTEYKLIGGCYVEVNGRFIPEENWRGEYEQQ